MSDEILDDLLFNNRARGQSSPSRKPFVDLNVGDQYRMGLDTANLMNDGGYLPTALTSAVDGVKVGTGLPVVDSRDPGNDGFTGTLNTHSAQGEAEILKELRTQRVQERHAMHQQFWETSKSRIATKIGRSETEAITSRDPPARKHLGNIDDSEPGISTRAASWLSQLRDTGQRQVLLNSSSGIYIAVKDKFLDKRPESRSSNRESSRSSSRGRSPSANRSGVGSSSASPETRHRHSPPPSPGGSPSVARNTSTTTVTTKQTSTTSDQSGANLTSDLIRSVLLWNGDFSMRNPTTLVSSSSSASQFGKQSTSGNVNSSYSVSFGNNTSSYASSSSSLNQAAMKKGVQRTSARFSALTPVQGCGLQVQIARDLSKASEVGCGAGAGPHGRLPPLTEQQSRTLLSIVDSLPLQEVAAALTADEISGVKTNVSPLLSSICGLLSPTIQATLQGRGAWPQVAMEATCGESSHATLKFANVGVCALKVSLSPQPPARPSMEQNDGKRISSSSGKNGEKFQQSLQESTNQSRNAIFSNVASPFECFPRVFTIVPGGVATVSVSFSPTSSGTSQFDWLIRASSTGDDRFLNSSDASAYVKYPGSNSGTSLSGSLSYKLRLRGFAASSVNNLGAPLRARMRIEQRMRDAAAFAAVREVLSALTDTVACAERPPKPQDVRENQRQIIAAANPDLVVSAEVADAFLAVFELIEAHEKDLSQALPPWTGSVNQLSEIIESIQPLPETDQERAAGLRAAAAREQALERQKQLQVEEEARAVSQKGKRDAKPPGANSASKRDSLGPVATPTPPQNVAALPFNPADLEVWVSPSLQRSQTISALRNELRTRVAMLSLSSALPKVEKSPLYAVVRQFVEEIIDTVPYFAAVSRLSVGEPLQMHSIAVPVSVAQLGAAAPSAGVTKPRSSKTSANEKEKEKNIASREVKGSQRGKTKADSELSSAVTSTQQQQQGRNVLSLLKPEQIQVERGMPVWVDAVPGLETPNIVLEGLFGHLKAEAVQILFKGAAEEFADSPEQLLNARVDALLRVDRMRPEDARAFVAAASENVGDSQTVSSDSSGSTIDDHSANRFPTGSARDGAQNSDTSAAGGLPVNTAASPPPVNILEEEWEAFAVRMRAELEKGDVYERERIQRLKAAEDALASARRAAATATPVVPEKKPAKTAAAASSAVPGVAPVPASAGAVVLAEQELAAAKALKPKKHPLASLLVSIPASGPLLAVSARLAFSLRRALALGLDRLGQRLAEIEAEDPQGYVINPPIWKRKSVYIDFLVRKGRLIANPYFAKSHDKYAALVDEKKNDSIASGLEHNDILHGINCVDVAEGGGVVRKRDEDQEEPLEELTKRRKLGYYDNTLYQSLSGVKAASRITVPLLSSPTTSTTPTGNLFALGGPAPFSDGFGGISSWIGSPSGLSPPSPSSRELVERLSRQNCGMRSYSFLQKHSLDSAPEAVARKSVLLHTSWERLPHSLLRAAAAGSLDDEEVVNADSEFDQFMGTAGSGTSFSGSNRSFNAVPNLKNNVVTGNGSGGTNKAHFGLNVLGTTKNINFSAPSSFPVEGTAASGFNNVPREELPTSRVGVIVSDDVSSSNTGLARKAGLGLGNLSLNLKGLQNQGQPAESSSSTAGVSAAPVSSDLNQDKNPGPTSLDVAFAQVLGITSARDIVPADAIMALCNEPALRSTARSVERILAGGATCVVICSTQGELLPAYASLGIGATGPNGGAPPSSLVNPLTKPQPPKPAAKPYRGNASNPKRPQVRHGEVESDSEDSVDSAKFSPTVNADDSSALDGQEANQVFTDGDAGEEAPEQSVAHFAQLFDGDGAVLPVLSFPITEHIPIWGPDWEDPVPVTSVSPVNNVTSFSGSSSALVGTSSASSSAGPGGRSTGNLNPASGAPSTTIQEEKNKASSTLNTVTAKGKKDALKTDARSESKAVASAAAATVASSTSLEKDCDKKGSAKKDVELLPSSDLQLPGAPGIAQRAFAASSFRGAAAALSFLIRTDDVSGSPPHSPITSISPQKFGRDKSRHTRSSSQGSGISRSNSPHHRQLSHGIPGAPGGLSRPKGLDHRIERISELTEGSEPDYEDMLSFDDSSGAPAIVGESGRESRRSRQGGSEPSLDIFSRQTLVVFVAMERPTDFTIFLAGSTADAALDVAKSILFEHAQMAENASDLIIAAREDLRLQEEYGPLVFVLENLSRSPTLPGESGSLKVAGLSDRRSLPFALRSAPGRPSLDDLNDVDVQDWTPTQVGRWVASLYPAAAFSEVFDDYALRVVANGVTGQRLLAFAEMRAMELSKNGTAGLIRDVQEALEALKAKETAEEDGTSSQTPAPETSASSVNQNVVATAASTKDRPKSQGNLKGGIKSTPPPAVSASVEATSVSVPAAPKAPSVTTILVQFGIHPSHMAIFFSALESLRARARAESSFRAHLAADNALAEMAALQAHQRLRTRACRELGALRIQSALRAHAARRIVSRLRHQRSKGVRTNSSSNMNSQDDERKFSSAVSVGSGSSGGSGRQRQGSVESSSSRQSARQKGEKRRSRGPALAEIVELLIEDVRAQARAKVVKAVIKDTVPPDALAAASSALVQPASSAAQQQGTQSRIGLNAGPSINVMGVGGGIGVRTRRGSNTPRPVSLSAAMYNPFALPQEDTSLQLQQMAQQSQTPAPKLTGEAKFYEDTVDENHRNPNVIVNVPSESATESPDSFPNLETLMKDYKKHFEVQKVEEALQLPSTSELLEQRKSTKYYPPSLVSLLAESDILPPMPTTLAARALSLALPQIRLKAALSRVADVFVQDSLLSVALSTVSGSVFPRPSQLLSSHNSAGAHSSVSRGLHGSKGGAARDSRQGPSIVRYSASSKISLIPTAPSRIFGPSIVQEAGLLATVLYGPHRHRLPLSVALRPQELSMLEMKINAEKRHLVIGPVVVFLGGGGPLLSKLQALRVFINACDAVVLGGAIGVAWVACANARLDLAPLLARVPGGIEALKNEILSLMLLARARGVRIVAPVDFVLSSSPFDVRLCRTFEGEFTETSITPHRLKSSAQAFSFLQADSLARKAIEKHQLLQNSENSQADVRSAREGNALLGIELSQPELEVIESNFQSFTTIGNSNVPIAPIEIITTHLPSFFRNSGVLVSVPKLLKSEEDIIDEDSASVGEDQFSSSGYNDFDEKGSYYDNMAFHGNSHSQNQVDKMNRSISSGNFVDQNQSTETQKVVSLPIPYPDEETCCTAWALPPPTSLRVIDLRYAQISDTNSGSSSIVTNPSVTETSGSGARRSLVSPHESILDIGPASCEAALDAVIDAGTVIIYGPMGVAETPDGAVSTEKLLNNFVSIAKGRRLISIIAGGSTVALARRAGFQDSLFSAVSENAAVLLCNPTLSGLSIIDDKY